MYPPGYGQYQAVSRAIGHTPNPMIAKFAARYRFAGQLNSIEILGASEASQTAYLISLRLALGYSALETLISALQLKGSIAITSPELASEFKSPRLGKFRSFLEEHSRPGVMARRLGKLVTTPDDSDVLPVVEATRHLMFHGVMNPTAAGLTTKTSILFLDRLGSRVFEGMNTKSSAYFEAFLKDSQKQC
jgi:hypothetical protein